MPTDNVGAVEVDKLSRVSDEENRMEELRKLENLLHTQQMKNETTHWGISSAVERSYGLREETGSTPVFSLSPEAYMESMNEEREWRS